MQFYQMTSFQKFSTHFCLKKRKESETKLAEIISGHSIVVDSSENANKNEKSNEFWIKSA